MALSLIFVKMFRRFSGKELILRDVEATVEAKALKFPIDLGIESMAGGTHY